MDTTERFHLEIFDRDEILLNKVQHILRFDEESLTIMTAKGKMMIEGRDLKIENLNHETGTAHIRGTIYSVYFSKKEMEKEKRVLDKKG